MTAVANPFDAARPKSTRGEIQSSVGKEIGVSRWIAIDQARLEVDVVLARDRPGAA